MKIVFYFPLFLLCAQFSFGQSFIGYETDNFNGIHGVMANPGNIAFQKNKVEVNLFSVAGTLANDLVEVDIFDVFDVFDGDFDVSRLNSGANDKNNVYDNLEVIGPSFILDLDPKEFSVAVFTKMRKITNYDNVNGDLLLGIADSFSDNDFTINQENFDSATHAWGELGLSFGHVLVDRLINGNEKHLLKAGASVKWLRGIGVELGYSNSIAGDYFAAANQLNLNGDLSYIKNGNPNAGLDDLVKKTGGQGVGMDVGVVYEWQTRKSIKEDDRKEDYRALNQYRLKVGVSVLDIGRIDYGTVRLSNYDLNGPVNTTAFESDNDFTDALSDYLINPQTDGKLKVQLPTRLRAEIDYKIMPFIYANVVHNQSLVKADDLFNNSVLNQTTFTARYETRKYSVYLPITFSKYGTINLIENSGLDVGIGVNIFGFVHIGSSSIISNLLSTKDAKANTANFYCGLKIPISWNFF